MGLVKGEGGDGGFDVGTDSPGVGGGIGAIEVNPSFMERDILDFEVGFFFVEVTS